MQWYPRDAGAFLSSSFDGLVNVWDCNRFESVYTFNLDEMVYSFALSQHATSHTLAAVACYGGSVRLCDLQGGTSAATLTAHEGDV